jgi:hypothetical protein
MRRAPLPWVSEDRSFRPDRQGLPRATLAARWAGARWVIERTPAPAHGRLAGFTGLACPSSVDCVAVGSYLARGGITRALIEQRR